MTIARFGYSAKEQALFDRQNEEGFRKEREAIERRHRAEQERKALQTKRTDSEVASNPGSEFLMAYATGVPIPFTGAAVAGALLHQSQSSSHSTESVSQSSLSSDTYSSGSSYSDSSSSSSSGGSFD